VVAVVMLDVVMLDVVMLVAVIVGLVVLVDLVARRDSSSTLIGVVSFDQRPHNTRPEPANSSTAAPIASATRRFVRRCIVPVQ
jgi:hypothetical protein